ncbi:MAG TPA: nickel-dependent hydrogenase large subunit, partial [Candidatus Nitrosotalea sp.]|nr:nickel-dependent hydrogenase large subunit [Candidatus Nitrosotalea sp.]
FASFDSNYMGLVQPDGALDHYDGNLRITDANGNIVEDQVPTDKYLEIIAEATEPWSYLKFPFIKRLGYPAGMYRVGPLARLNLASKITTPQANAALREWKAGSPVRRSSFYYHWARLIELLYALERIQELLEDREICSTDIMINDRPANEQGVGVIEAPRGTLFHHYWVDRNGSIEKVNLIVATGHNNLAMNHAVLSVAKKYVKGNQLKEGMLNRVEAAIRCYDPCLSCSTHAVGQMPLHVQLVAADGAILNEVSRG